MKQLSGPSRKIAAVCLKRKVRLSAGAALVGLGLTAPPGGFVPGAPSSRLLSKPRLMATFGR